MADPWEIAGRTITRGERPSEGPSWRYVQEVIGGARYDIEYVWIEAAQDRWVRWSRRRGRGESWASEVVHDLGFAGNEDEAGELLYAYLERKFGVADDG